MGDVTGAVELEAATMGNQDLVFQGSRVLTSIQLPYYMHDRAAT